VLFEGEYSGALEPMVHYVPLKQDFSNFDEVVAAIRDPELRRRITERAYDDLIASGRFGYEKLIEDVDRDLIGAGLLDPAPEPERAALTRALRAGRLRRVVRRRSTTTLRYMLNCVVSPVSLRVRRRLGLPVPSG
jgi:hypothetical protein